MRSNYHFIIESSHEFNECFTTVGGLVLFGDKRHLQNRLANQIAKVVALPLLDIEDEIQVGYEVFIDYSTFLRFISDSGVIENNYTIDKDRGLYKIPASMIYLYRRNASDEWRGYRDNLVVTSSLTSEGGTSNLVNIVWEKPKKEYFLEVLNDELIDCDVQKGDKVLCNTEQLLPIFMNGKEVFHLRNRDVFAVYEK